MSPGIIELAAVMLLATTLGIIAKLFKQPLILAFISTGAIISYFGFFHLNNHETLKIFSDLGIMFLLFLVGLEIDFASLKFIGKSSFIIATAQIIGTFLIMFGIAQIFHFSYLQSAYIAIGLTLSSTVIVIKLLSEKKDKKSLYGKITIGVLLIQDLVAVFILVLLSGIKAGNGFVIGNAIFVIIKGLILFAVIFFVGRKILPLLFDRLAYSQELLFLSSLSWCFLMAAIISHPKIGFPIEIGGLLAGLALANSSENFQISSKIKYLRDFFILIFFVILGSNLIFSNLPQVVFLSIIFSIVVLVGTPLIILTIMGLLGYHRKTAFLTGLSLGQVSELSLVLAALGAQLGHLSQEIVSLITMTGIITIAASSYLIVYSDYIYQKFSRFLKFFEKKIFREMSYAPYEHQNHKSIVLIGLHRLGQSIAYNIPKEDLLIVDFDPQIMQEIKKHGYDCVFGDISDDDLFERVSLKNARTVISTVPDVKDNIRLLKEIRSLKIRGQDIKSIVRAEEEYEMEILYNEGADYVIFPHFTSGQYLGKSIAIDPKMSILRELKEWDLKVIKKLRGGG
ncbi:MAG: cation:proton antiporter [Patescibacteria group bacterium]|nr:cation:proton antiporter [Patescibacteria group bacterium]